MILGLEKKLYISSIMFCTAMKVLGPVEQPKSATQIGFADENEAESLF